jgi:diguanylate cyclase (GGDEF)-like protein/PAS domain S-box-containing protein
MGPDGSESTIVDDVVGPLLDRYPDAALCAIGEDGLSVAMPESLPTRDHQIVAARSPVDVVVAEDRVVVITAWDRARTTGAPSEPVTVRLADDPARSVDLHLIDVRPSHGVFLAVFVPGHDAENDENHSGLFGGEPLAVVPRFARVRQNEVGVFLEVDQALTQILGWSEPELVGQLSLEFIHPDDHEPAIDNWMSMLASHGPLSRVRLRHRHRDGSWVWMEITNHNRLDDSDHRDVVAEMLDVSDEMAAHEALRARQQLLERLAETLPVGVVQIDADGRVLYTNNRLHDIVGVPRAVTVDEQLITVVPDDGTALAAAFDAALTSGLDSDLEVRIGATAEMDGADVRRCLFSLRVLTADTGEVTGAIVCVADVTESARLREELRLQATVDGITGCHNRVSTMTILETLLSGPAGSGRPAVIFVDLDRFKEVNDKLGHAAGDELLSVVAQRLQRAVRSDDIVGRIGGDEFLVIRPGVTTVTQAMTTAKRLAATFHHHVRLKAGRLPCRASIGVAWSPDPVLDAQGLVAMADAAMYVAKRSGSRHPILHTLDLPMRKGRST